MQRRRRSDVARGQRQPAAGIFAGAAFVVVGRGVAAAVPGAIVVSKLDVERAAAELHTSVALESLEFHTVEWVTESLRERRRMASTEFLSPSSSSSSSSSLQSQSLSALPGGSPAEPTLQLHSNLSFDWAPDGSSDDEAEAEAPRTGSAAFAVPAVAAAAAPPTPLATPPRPKRPREDAEGSGSGSAGWLSYDGAAGTPVKRAREGQQQQQQQQQRATITPVKSTLKRIASAARVDTSPFAAPPSPSLSPDEDGAGDAGDRGGSGTQGPRKCSPPEPSGAAPAAPVPLPLLPRSPASSDDDGDGEGDGDEADEELGGREGREGPRGGREMDPAKWACQRVSEARRADRNAAITGALARLAEAAKCTGDRWRTMAYEKAANLVRSLDYEVTSVSQVRHLRGLGAKMQQKIGEILETGHLRRVDALDADERTKTLALFSKIHGAGPETVQKWYAQGLRTIEDVRARAVLNHAQSVGIKYIEEFEARIPREEVGRIEAVVQQQLEAISPDLKMVTRGRETCGDVDILITDTKGGPVDHVVPRLAAALHAIGFLTDDLTKTFSDKYMGVCVVQPPGVHRRIDLQAKSLEEWPFALLYFTGSGHFNRSMRLWARKHGYSLSEHGIVPRWGDPKKDICGDPIPVSTEYEIFQLLGLEYRPPEQRDV
eukprot:m51a1_g8082 hypothetical protein (660) ;mRNA; f:19581-22193